MTPDLFHETAHEGPVCGIDEAGRGPWAGPVVAAAVIFHACDTPEGIDDSKKLLRDRREALFPEIHLCAHVGVGIASVEEIDALNILQATMLAMVRAVNALPVAPRFALVDGNRAPSLPCPARTVIGGDGACLSIAAASIVAKVTRDRLMGVLAAEHPGYGWERNVGYGTREHQEGLRAHGLTVHHRRSFSPIRLLAEAA